MSHSGDAADNIKDMAIDFVAGSLGGIGSVYVGQPLDTVKVKMQTFPALYKGMVDCFRQTLMKEGVARGLYAGTVPAIAANVAENSVLFACYGVCQKAIAKALGVQNTGDLSTLANASAGFFAAFFSSLVLCPTELVKCQLQAMREVQMQSPKKGDTVNKIGPFRLTKNILQKDGISGLFRGLTSTIAREMPGYFFFFGGYEASRTFLTSEGQTKDEIGPLKTMVSGAIGGVVFWMITFPADVIKSRIQVAGSKETMRSVLMGIIRKEGPGALYNGLRPTIVRTIPATATLFLVYENSKKLMHYFAD